MTTSNEPAAPAMTVRKTIFWLHLSAGVIAGLVILAMSVTGVMLAFEPQIVEFAERDLRIVAPPGPDADRLSVDALLTKAREEVPDAPPTGVTVRSAATASVVVNFGRDGRVFVDPYTGDILGRGSKTHAFLHTVEDWHRWFGSREVGRPITGAANAAFLVMAVTGVYLWWPRRWTRSALKAVTRFTPGLKGKARDWNWHNVIGVWCAPLLIVITLTGLVMSYQWANTLLYRLTGNESPPPQQQRAGGGPPGGDRTRTQGSSESMAQRPPLPNLDPFVARAEQQVAGWVAISLRFPQRPEGPFTALIQEPEGWHPNPRSQLTLNPVTAAVVKWEPFSGANLGRKLRLWVRPLHTGEAGGLIGQLLALLASAGGAVLVWTGLAMAWRRLVHPKSSAAAATDASRATSRRTEPLRRLSRGHPYHQAGDGTSG
jgi:uncharacterized iron-regulated membrane protein